MKTLKKIIIFIVSFFIIFGISNSIYLSYSNYNIIPQNSSVSNKQQLDKFLNDVLISRSTFKNDSNYLIFINNLDNRLDLLRNQFSNNTQVVSMISYLKEGINNIRIIAKENSDIDAFFCELFGDCTNVSNTSTNTNSNTNSNTSTNTNNISNNWKIIDNKFSFPINKTNIDRICGIGYKLPTNNDWLSIRVNGDLFNDIGKSLKLTDGYYWTDSGDLFYVYGNKGDSGFLNILNTEQKNNLSVNNTAYGIRCIKDLSINTNVIDNNENSSVSVINNIPKLSCPSGWSWMKSGSTENCTKTGGHFSCPEIAGFECPAGQSCPNHWNNVNGKITTCSFTYTGKNITTNISNNGTVSVKSSNLGRVVEYYTCGSKENGPNRRVHFFDQEAWEGRNSNSIDGSRGPWKSCDTCFAGSSDNSNTLCGNDKIIESTESLFINISSINTSASITKQSIKNGGEIVTLYGYVKSGDSCRLDASSIGSYIGSSLPSGRGFSQTFYVDSKSYVNVNCTSGNYNFKFTESGLLNTNTNISSNIDTSLNCSSTIIDGYQVNSRNNGLTFNALKQLNINGGVKDYSQNFICRNGTFSKSGTESVITKCNTGLFLDVANNYSCYRLNSTETMVNGLYNEIFGRTGDLPGIRYWSGQYTSNQMSRIELANHMANAGLQTSDRLKSQEWINKNN